MTKRRKGDWRPNDEKAIEDQKKKPFGEDLALNVLKANSHQFLPKGEWRSKFNPIVGRGPHLPIWSSIFGPRSASSVAMVYNIMKQPLICSYSIIWLLGTKTEQQALTW